MTEEPFSRKLLACTQKMRIFWNICSSEICIKKGVPVCVGLSWLILTSKCLHAELRRDPEKSKFLANKVTCPRKENCENCCVFLGSNLSSYLGGGKSKMVFCTKLGQGKTMHKISVENCKIV